MTNIPNIFNYATSELSQDAFLCYLAKWADKDYRDVDRTLNKWACEFIRELLQIKELKVEKIEILRQWEKIDVSIIVNNKYFILIEDKKGTSEHSNQLERYRKKVEEKYGDQLEIKLVYFKMEEQGNYNKVKESGYFRLTREKMLRIMSGYIEETGNNYNQIIKEYYENLAKLDERIKSFLTLEFRNSSQEINWTRDSWTGFYTKLQEFLVGTNWEYVSNPRGGFLGLWWHWIEVPREKGFYLYLQLEQEKLTFRLSSQEFTDKLSKEEQKLKAEELKQKRREIKDKYQKVLLRLSQEEGIDLKASNRIGKTMRVAVNRNYIKTDEKNILDLEKTVKGIRKMENLLDKVNMELQKG